MIARPVLQRLISSDRTDRTLPALAGPVRGPGAAGHVLRLQQQAGNWAVTRLLTGSANGGRPALPPRPIGQHDRCQSSSLAAVQRDPQVPFTGPPPENASRNRVRYQLGERLTAAHSNGTVVPGDDNAQFLADFAVGSSVLKPAHRAFLDRLVVENALRGNDPRAQLELLEG